MRLPCVLVTVTSACAVLCGVSSAEVKNHVFTNSGENVFVVPVGVESVGVRLVGGAGSPALSADPQLGGSGASVEATLAVTPGEVLFAEVGGYFEDTPVESGVEAVNGGAPGGGEGGATGGGASDVRTCSANPASLFDPLACAGIATLESRLLVAGGGGGAGSTDFDEGATDLGGAGGNAGAPGSDGAEDPEHHPGGSGGGAGTVGAGGAGGLHSPEKPAAAGTLARGGRGGGSSAGGGGGGGGIYGGGGGGAGGGDGPLETEFSGGGGGGGGSSGVPGGIAGVSEVSIATAAHQATPKVVFMWTVPSPTVAGGEATAIGSESATLEGTVTPNNALVSDCHFQIVPAPQSGDSAPCREQVGTGTLPIAVSANVDGLAPATAYTATLSATSPPGTSTGEPVTFTTAARVITREPIPPAAQTPGGASVRPRVSGLRLAPARFRGAKRPARIVAGNPRAPAGATAIGFTLSRAATATLGFEQARTGVRSGNRCLAHSRSAPAGKRCTRYAAIASMLSLRAGAGRSTIEFDGVIARGRQLVPGRYRLILSVSNAGGSTTAAGRPTFVLLG